MDLLRMLSLGQWFLVAMGVEYLLAAGVFLWQKNPGYALTMLCYGIANFGLLWAEGR